MGYDVICIGSATVDAFIKTASDELIDIKTPSSEEAFTCYPLGSKILIKDLQFMTGGGGTNTAVSFRRLGFRAAYLGNVGDDANGKRVIEELKREKIDFIGTVTKHQTNYSVILDSIGHDRTILVYRDASDHMSFSRISKLKLDAKWFYLSSMVGESFDAALNLMEFAKKKRIKVGYNPSLYQVKEGRSRLKPLLKDVDVLIFNKEEAETLLETKCDHMAALMKGCHELGPQTVVITDGPRGAWCSDRRFLYFIGPRKVKVVETTGAGDAFASGFIAGLNKFFGRKDMIECSLRLGLEQAESVIQYYGAKNKLLTWKEASSEMAKHKVSVTKTRI